MSRRSLLLASTIFIAIGSLAAPASARGFGFGGFDGGAALRLPAVASIAHAPIPSMSRFDGGRFNRAPVGSATGEGNVAGSRLQPSQLPAIANAPITNSAAAMSAVRPAQLPPIVTSAGNGIQRPSIDAAGVIRPSASVSNQIQNVSAAEGRGKLPRPSSYGQVPDVTGPDATVIALGHPDTGHGPSVPGVKTPDGPDINLPGSTMGQKGPPEVPGFGSGMGGAGHLNTPGSMQQHGADDSTKKLAEQEKAEQQLLKDAGKGGVNSLNTSAGVSPGERESDKYGAETSGGASGANFVNTGRPIDPVINTGKPVKVWTSKGSDLNGGTVVVTNVSSDTIDQTTIVQTSKDGKTTTKTTSYDPKTSAIIWTKTTTTGGDGKNNTPNDDSTNSHDIGSLAPGSSLGRLGQGGGTDNNGTETTSSQTSQLAPGATSGRTGNGDGNDGRGDNNHVGNDGTLAAGSIIARKDYGDGGGSDTRGGGTTMGGVKVQPGGGNPSQLNAAAALRN